MAEVLGGIGENIDTTKFNGTSNDKTFETVAIKKEEVCHASIMPAILFNFLLLQLFI